MSPARWSLPRCPVEYRMKGDGHGTWNREYQSDCRGVCGGAFHPCGSGAVSGYWGVGRIFLDGLECTSFVVRRRELWADIPNVASDWVRRRRKWRIVGEHRYRVGLRLPQALPWKSDTPSLSGGFVPVAVGRFGGFETAKPAGWNMLILCYPVAAECPISQTRASRGPVGYNRRRRWDGSSAAIEGFPAMNL